MKAKKILSVILSVILVLGSCITVIADDIVTVVPDTDWYNDTDTQFTLTDAADLYGFAQLVNSGNTFSGKTVKLGESVDLKNQEWTPIGTKANSFKGSFDGNGKTVKNLVINGSMDYDGGTGMSYVGLFGYVNNGGYIKNITIENVDVSGCLYVGAIVGRVYIGDEIENCHVKGNIKVDGYWYVGGLAGRYEYADGIRNCSVAGAEDGASYIKADVTLNSDQDGSYVGGIVGFVAEGAFDITNCSVANVAISGCTRIGGITGLAHYGNLVEGNSVSNVTVTSNTDTDMIGLIAGANQGGQNNGEVKQASYVINNSVSNTTAENANGKVANLSGVTINGTKPEATVVGTDVTFDENGKVNGGNLELITGNDKVNGGILADGFAVKDDGTVDEAYVISTADGLVAFANEVNNGNSFKDEIVVLENDIDMLSEYEESAETIIPIGTKENPFNGTFDGQGNTISNLYIWDDTRDYVGLFGFTNGIIKNVTVKNPYFVGRAYVGGIAGCAYTGKIENCHVTGEIDIEGNYMVGGISGHGYAKLIDCSVIGAEDWAYNIVMAEYLEADLEGDNVGGIVGHNAEGGTITNCDVKNITVTGTRKVGGVVGTAFQNNNITECDVVNVKVTTNATEEYAASKAGSMGIGGIVGLTSDDSYTGGKIADCTISEVTFEIENNLTTPVSAGAITGGHRGTTAPVAPEDTTVENNTVDTATVVGATNDFFAVEEEKFGTLSAVYTSDSTYWGECGGNASESFEFKLYNDNTYMGYTLLNNVGGIIDGDVYVSWHIKLDTASNTDEYWTMAWEIAPTVAMQPNRVEQWVDGVKVAECAIQPNWADNLFPVVAAVTDSDGKILSYVNNHEDATLENAFANAKESETIYLLKDSTPEFKSQRAITKASVIDLGGHTLTLTEDDLYFGTTTFKNGNIVVDSSVKPSTAVFWMFANQTLTFDNVKIYATGVSGTYLIGLDGDNSDLNLINGSEIIVENDIALDLDIICVNASTGNDIVIDNSKVIIKNLDGRVFFRGNYVVSGNSDIDIDNVKAGFRIEANQTLTIKDNATVDIGTTRDGGIHLTDTSAVYTKAETTTVNATVSKPIVEEEKLETKNAFIRNITFVDDNGVTKYQVVLLGGIDSLDYKKVGFEVTVNGMTQEISTNKVYTAINVTDGDGKVTTLNPSDFGDGLVYIFGEAINFTESYKTMSLTYRPFAIDKNGNYIYGSYSTVDMIYNLDAQ